MIRRWRVCRLAALSIALGASGASAQSFPIGVVDFYGLHRVSIDDARRALTFAVGDSISFADGERPAFLAESERRLAAIPGVLRARTEIVCCEDGRVIVYVGVEEKGAPSFPFRPAPKGDARLAPDVIEAGNDFSKAFTAAVERGEAGEDDSHGHALSHDPPTRVVQERFIRFAARDGAELRRVVRESSAADERALAALVIGYVADKQTAVDDLVYAMSDPSVHVRNNAMRALAVFAKMKPVGAQRVPRIRYDPFIALLASPLWTDRNKASLALMGLSESRDAALLTQLRRDAMEPLVEMARWKSQGHALPALLILGRIGGWSDEAVNAAWGNGAREDVINAALRKH